MTHYLSLVISLNGLVGQWIGQRFNGKETVCCLCAQHKQCLLIPAMERISEDNDISCADCRSAHIHMHTHTHTHTHTERQACAYTQNTMCLDVYLAFVKLVCARAHMPFCEWLCALVLVDVSCVYQDNGILCIFVSAPMCFCVCVFESVLSVVSASAFI